MGRPPLENGTCGPSGLTIAKRVPRCRLHHSGVGISEFFKHFPYFVVNLTVCFRAFCGLKQRR
jgi:hypothetical protein